MFVLFLIMEQNSMVEILFYNELKFQVRNLTVFVLLLWTEQLHLYLLYSKLVTKQINVILSLYIQNRL